MTVAIPQISLAATMPAKVDVLVIGLADDEDKPALVGLTDTLNQAVTETFGSDVLTLALALGASTNPGKIAILPPVKGMKIVVVGMGIGEPDPELVRRAAAAGVRAAAGDAPVVVAVDLECDDPEMVQGCAEGALLGAYVPLKITKTPQPAKYKKIVILSQNKSKDAKTALDVAAISAENVYLCRDWINQPANELYPETFANAAKEVVSDTTIKVEIFDEKRLVKEGWGGVTQVGAGSVHAPRVVRYSYAPAGAKFHLVLVGKGITFDSGGLNIKPADGMYTMKCDMGGAATVLTATRAIAQLGLKIKITTYAAMCENMPSGSSYRPSDVLTMYGGKTVENVNCDAEGRLVMADCLARANEDKPDMVIDVATLTGACIVALGNKIAGLMSNDEEAAESILDSAEMAGENFWQLPMLFDELKAELDSKIADIKSGGGRMGGAMTAAAFLHEFVDEQTPWAHLDIAGPAFNTEAPFGHVPTGGTGHGVRTLIALAESLQA